MSVGKCSRKNSNVARLSVKITKRSLACLGFQPKEDVPL